MTAIVIGASIGIIVACLHNQFEDWLEKRRRKANQIAFDKWDAERRKALAATEKSLNATYHAERDQFITRDGRVI